MYVFVVAHYTILLRLLQPPRFSSPVRQQTEQYSATMCIISTMQIWSNVLSRTKNIIWNKVALFTRSTVIDAIIAQ